MTSSNAALSPDLLHQYQRRACAFIHDTPRCALFLGLGLGKTISTLTAFNGLYMAGEVDTLLVVAPLTVARSTWDREVSNWSHLRGFKVSKVLGNAKERKEALNRDAQIYVINRENVTWLIQQLRVDKRLTPSGGFPFDMVVLDESQSFKNAKSKRFKALKFHQEGIKRLVLLTATPAANNLLDIWSQIYLIDGGKRLGRSMTKFKNTYFIANYNGFGHTPMAGSKEVIFDLIKDVCLTMRTEDYLELPPLLINDLYVNLPVDLMLQYKKLEKEFLVQLQDAVDGDKESTVVALNAASLTAKLRQFTAGCIYDINEDNEPIFDENGQRSYTVVHSAKIEMIKELVEASENPVIVVYEFVSEKMELLKGLPGAELLDIDRWNNDEIPVMLVNAASASTGLNLQHGTGTTIIWASVTYSLEYFLQLNARLHRQGQTKPVTVFRINAAGTVDESVIASLEKKDTNQTDLLMALRADIERRENDESE